MVDSVAESGVHHHDDVVVQPSKDIVEHALISQVEYKRLYQKSIEEPEKFWEEQAGRLDWFQPFTDVKHTSFEDDVSINWFADGKLNVCYNCVDRHVESKGDKVALIWEGDNPEESKKVTYSELFDAVCRFANVLKAQGVKKGDRVLIYMPMILEATYAMLACARIGAVHSVVFGGFSPESIHGRMEDCTPKLIITADEGVRGGKKVPLKANVDAAFAKGDCGVQKVLVVKRTGGQISWDEKRDVWYHEVVKDVEPECDPEVMGAEDPLFILYTSGSTGKPKGVLHTTAGYLLYAAITHEYVFDVKDNDIYWCTADVGWVTGHSYIVYGPLANGATSLVFEGVPSYPDMSRCWQVVDKHNVTIFYTAPTAIRALMREGEEPVAKTSRKSLRILGSVGEPINPEAWNWYYEVVGDKRCPIMDTWWQTETGGFLITPLPTTPLKPGSATLPFFGVNPAIVDEKGKVLEGEAEGALCILDAWPGMMRSVYGDHARFKATYFSQFPGKYFSGDGARRDKDGYYWITGRMDDVLNVSGHRLGTAEVESALVAHHKVAEAAVVGYPHEIKGQGIYCFVILKNSVEPSEELRKELVAEVRKEIGPIATPDLLQFVPGLPKTRSGKIMRRILRKIACNDYGNLGDTNTLMNPEVVEVLIENRLNKQVRHQ